MNSLKEITENLEKLRRNEINMSEEQKTQYAHQLCKLRKKIAEKATKILKSFLLSGIQILKDEDGAKVIDRINRILAEEQEKGTFQKICNTLYLTYSVDKFLVAAIPIYNRIMYEGYAPYWVKHCILNDKKDFSFRNDIIKMEWCAEHSVWKTKDAWSIMLPPTMELIQKEYNEEKEKIENYDRTKNESND